MLIYSLIPARKGSKRIRNKNLLKIKNKYLINITVSSSISTKLINKTFVSTNDRKISDIVDKSVHVIDRPEKISQDKSTTEDAIIHFIKYLKKRKIENPDIIVLLQCTSPCREKNDSQLAINKLLKFKFDSLFSACKNKNLFWLKKNNKLKPINYKPKKRLREQKMQEQYIENGSIYVFNTKGFVKNKCRLFGKIGIHIMKKKNSYQIDDHEDIEIITKLND